MKVINGKRARDQVDPETARKNLLAQVHIAKKELGYTDDAYRDILEGRFAASTAAALRLHELDELVEYFKEQGWKPKYTPSMSRGDFRMNSLRNRCKFEAGKLSSGDKALKTLVKKHCGVESIDWVHNEKKLKHLLAILGGMVRKAREEGKLKQERG